jgi:hypothetical protein
LQCALLRACSALAHARAVLALTETCSTCSGEMAGAVGALQKLARDAQRGVQQDRRLTPSARAASSGPVPSVDECLEGLAAIG